jgi:hypothetical protein
MSDNKPLSQTIKTLMRRIEVVGGAVALVVAAWFLYSR